MVLRGITYLGWLHTRQTEPAAQALSPCLILECMLTIKQYIQSSQSPKTCYFHRLLWIKKIRNSATRLMLSTI